MNKLRPAIKPTQRQAPYMYDHRGMRIPKDPRVVPFWLGVCLVESMWFAAEVFL